MNMDARKSLSEQGTTEDLWRKCNLEHICLQFLSEGSLGSDDFKVAGNSFHTLDAATEKTRLAKLSVVSGTISCCEIDDLSCQGHLKDAED